MGNVCQDNCDGDAALDADDACSCNAQIQFTDFRNIQPIPMGDNPWGQPDPVWEFKNGGKEIQQKVNSAPGVAIGSDKLGGVDYEGTFYVADQSDNDWIGAIFSFQVSLCLIIDSNQTVVSSQDSSHFYLLISAKNGSNQVGDIITK